MTFHKIDNDSVNSITNALDFFTIPPTNVSVSSAKVFEVLTSNPLNTFPYHFKIHSSQTYIDLSKCYLFSEFRIRKEENGQLVNLTAADMVGPIQLIGQTFINNIKISINGREVFNANSLYAYQAYFSHELSYPLSAKRSHLNAAGYYPDPENSLESGEGYDARRALFSLSKTAQFMAKIDAPLFKQPLYLINQCEVDIEIFPNNANFLLISQQQNTTFSFETVDLRMYVKKCSLTEGLALTIDQKLSLKPARYALRRTLLKSLFINTGVMDFRANVSMDQVPRRIILGLVANQNYVGRISHSPFNFEPFNVNRIEVITNGCTYPQAPYLLDYPNKRYVRPFNDMNEAIGFTNSLESNGITYKAYGKNRTIYVFNLSNSLDDNAGLFDLIRNGTTAVHITFSAPVPAGGVMLICMLELDSLLMMDKNRTIATDTTI